MTLNRYKPLLIAVAMASAIGWLGLTNPFAQADDRILADPMMLAQVEPAGMPSAGGPIQAGPRAGGPGQMMAQLNLTSQQKQQLKTMFQQNRMDPAAHRQIAEKRRQLLEMMKNGSGSKEQALALHREVESMQARTMEQRITMIYGMKTILTPQQFQTFTSQMQQRRQQGGMGAAGGAGGLGGGFRRPGGMGQSGPRGGRLGQFRQMRQNRMGGSGLPGNP